MKKIQSEELKLLKNPKVGMKVFTSEMYIGKITEVIDEHNIYVKYINVKGSRIYCLVKKCKSYDPLWEIV